MITTPYCWWKKKSICTSRYSKIISWFTRFYKVLKNMSGGGLSSPDFCFTINSWIPQTHGRKYKKTLNPPRGWDFRSRSSELPLPHREETKTTQILVTGSGWVCPPSKSGKQVWKASLQVSQEKNPYYFPLYCLFSRDPYNSSNPPYTLANRVFSLLRWSCIKWACGEKKETIMYDSI